MGGGSGFPAWCPLFLPRPWLPAHDCWNLWLSLGHHRGDSSCTWCVDACGMAVAGCLVVPHACVLWGLPAQSCLHLGPSVAAHDWVWMQDNGLYVAVSQGDGGHMAELPWGTNCSPGHDKFIHVPESAVGLVCVGSDPFLPSVQ